jgi:hypothetical protein
MNREMEEPTLSSAAATSQHVAATGSIEEAREALKYGPRGALVIASISIAMLILGWLAFYFLLFMPRGDIS